MSGPFDRDPSGRLPEPVDVELERALEHASRPEARAEFRAALRERFVHGDADLADHSSSARPLAAAARAPRPATASRWRGWSAAAALIAAVLVLAFFLTRDGAEPGVEEIADGVEAPAVPMPDEAPDQAPAAVASGGWKVLAASGSITIDEEPVDVADAAALERALVGAKRVRVDEGGRLRLRLADLMLVQLGAPEDPSEIVLAGCTRVPREGSERAIDARSGAVLVATGPGFDGLSIATPDIDLTITGTALAVDVYDTGTCVCCSEGHVAIQDRASSCSHALSPDEMAFVHRDLTPCDEGPIIPNHAPPLTELVRAAEELWGPR